VLESITESTGIPVWFIKTGGDEYTYNFEKTLQRAKENGAEACVFGDIDLEGHLKWCTERCENVGIEPVFPLFGQSRESVVYGFIESGFTAHITIIDTAKLSGDLIGRVLTKETLMEIKAQGADICGENGEYHTFVSAGPIFKKPVRFSFGEVIEKDGRIVMPLES